MRNQESWAVDRRTVRAAIELASCAPSVHNSQPWRWMVGPRSVHLYADMRRWLPVTDADGRDLVISCGAALHHLQIALAASGLATDVHRLPNPDEPDHLAAITLRPAAPAEAEVSLATALLTRRTDRRRFSTWEVPSAFVEELVDEAAKNGALLRPVTKAGPRRLLHMAIRAAARAQQETPGYQTETALWSGGTADGTGIPAANLLRDPIGTGAGTARRFATGTIVQTQVADDEAEDDDGAVLFVLGATSDDTLSQLRAGEAAGAVLLHATVLGLATCPLTQPLEVSETRAAVRDHVLSGTLSPQLVLRIGWAPDRALLPATPRRPVDDTIERMP